MTTQQNPEMMGPRLGDIYTPVDPLPDLNDMTEDEMLVDDPSLDESQAEMPGSPSERPEQPTYDGDVDEQTPGHHEADRDFQYDQEDVDKLDG